MDCKFINQNDIHEKYLSDRLDESEKAEYLSHLNSCDSCKSKLDSEKELIASVRHFGKSEMKSEISRQVAEIKSKDRDVSWDMILKVAAIFFFLVITPGLVYYYQSVEPPQISELYDFDEVVKQQKESEKVEAEEDIEDRDSAIDKRKREIKEHSSDLLKSVSGAGTQPSVQSIGMTKSVKKSIPRVEKTADLLTEEDIDIESEHPVPAAPISTTQSSRIAKSSMASEETKEEALLDDVSSKMEQTISETPKTSIPELENYHKPFFVGVRDHELSRAKVLSSKKLSTTSHSQMSNQIKEEQFDKEEISAAGRTKSEQNSLDKLLEDNIIKLDYKINDQTIIVNLIPLYDNSDFYLQELLPDSFSVIIKQNISVNLAMDWFINSAIEKVKPDDILLKLSENNLIFINIQNTKFYQIDLKSDTTKAVTIQ